MKAVVLGSGRRSDVQVGLAREPEGADADPPWDALIGVGFLKAGRVIYDPAGDRVWLDITNEFTYQMTLRAPERFACKARERRHAWVMSSEWNAAGGPLRGSRRACLSASLAAFPALDAE